MNIDTLYDDFKEFQLRHSWYKHNPLGGRDFYVYQTTDSTTWQFSGDTAPVGIHPVYKVRFGPFLRGLQGKGTTAWGLWIIRTLATKPVFDTWISNNYPEWIGLDWDRVQEEMDTPIVLELFLRESEKYWYALLAALGIDALPDIQN